MTMWEVEKRLQNEKASLAPRNSSEWWKKDNGALIPEKYRGGGSDANVALFCFSPGCRACSSFSIEDRNDWESKNIYSGTDVLEWNCSDERKRDFAMRMGASNLPSYIFLSSDGKHRVVSVPA